MHAVKQYHICAAKIVQNYAFDVVATDFAVRESCREGTSASVIFQRIRMCDVFSIPFQGAVYLKIQFSVKCDQLF